MRGQTSVGPGPPNAPPKQTPPKFSSSPPSRLGFGLRPLPLAALPPVRLDQLGELILGLVPSQAHPTQVQGRLGGHDLSNLLDLGEAKVARRDHPVGAFQGEDVPARKEHAVHRDGRVALGADVNLRRRATHKIIKKKDIEHERKRHDMRAGGQSTIPLARTRCAALALILIISSFTRSRGSPSHPSPSPVVVKGGVLGGLNQSEK